MKIYHNPRCRKSRETLALIQENDQEAEIIRYLETPPSREELKLLLQHLGISAADLVRKGEKLYKEQFKGKEISEEEWLDILTENPILIERPIVVKGARAIIGRPPERVLDLL